MKRFICTCAALAMAAMAPALYAQDAGDFVFRFGIHTLSPKSDSHSPLNVDSATMPTFTGTYMVSSHVAVELLAALPFKHDINLNGSGKVGQTRQLPPTLSLQYHINPNGRLRPYVGAGVNYTVFFDEKTEGALAGSQLQLDPSFGVATQAGFDLQLTSDWYFNADVRWMDIDTTAKLNGARLTKVQIDPYAIGVSLVRKF